MILENLEEHILVLRETIKAYEQEIINVANECCKRLQASGRIYILGNGGSAADAQHMAAELVGCFNKKNRKALPAIALTTDTSVITSVSNDFTYDNVFSRQIEAFVTEKDVVIAISTSGNSTNVINALIEAKKKNCYIIGLSGNNGGKMNNYCNKNIIVNSTKTPIIQEIHLFIEHRICDIIDNQF
jgi:D-sedoheptulose 7-phosphate isomerase